MLCIIFQRQRHTIQEEFLNYAFKGIFMQKCGDMHKRPINSKCPFGSPQSIESDSENVTVPGASGVSVQSDDSTALNVQILAELKSLGGRMTAMEDRMAKSEQQEVDQRSNASGTQAAAASTSDSSRLEQVVVPSMAALQGSSHIQAEVDRRIRHLTDLNEAGKLKSQRGGNDTIFVKRQVPWPQNFVLGGNNKTRLLYNNLNWTQWISGFAMIAREEHNIAIKMPCSIT